jgi:predicted ATPase/DNA-binding CsgD family transcriptional regulator
MVVRLHSGAIPTFPLQDTSMAVHVGLNHSREGADVELTLESGAYLLAAARPGQVLFSAAAASYAVGSLPPDVALRELGSYQLLDLARPRQVFQLVLPGAATHFPPLQPLDEIPHNLPTQLTRFVGRGRQLRQVVELLTESSLLTLTGPGGVGKSRLALQAAASMSTEYRDGVWLVELAPLREPDELLQAIAAVLGVSGAPGWPLGKALVAHLLNKRTLLILDNCEHLVGACAEMAITLLRACPHLRILATGREPLGVAGETVLSVPPLSTPLEPGEATDAELWRYEAVRLFIERATAVRPGFSLTQQNAREIAYLCVRLDGLPLAIELAAKRVKAMSVAELNARIGDRFGLLSSGCRTAAPRQSTLRAAVDWSYELLTAHERLFWSRLGVFAGDFTLPAAEEVCTGDGLDSAEATVLLVQLVEKSLVTVSQQHGETTYCLLQTLQQYAAEKLTASGLADSVRDRHLGWYVAQVERAASAATAMEQQRWDEWLEREHGNLRAALEWAASSGANERGLRMAVLLEPFWGRKGRCSEGVLGQNEPVTASGATRALPDRSNRLLVQGKLTTRELEVARLVASGLSNPQISRQLSISPRTVGRHLENMFLKLQRSSRAQLIAWAFETGIV